MSDEVDPQELKENFNLLQKTVNLQSLLASMLKISYLFWV